MKPVQMIKKSSTSSEILIDIILRISPQYIERQNRHPVVKHLDQDDYYIEPSCSPTQEHQNRLKG